jgi:hypothetical protein
VVVRAPNGRFLGIAPKAGVSSSRLGTRLAPRSPKRFSSTGNLDYNGGPVLHSSAAYLILWDPSASGIPSGSRALLQRYLTDAAADRTTQTVVVRLRA